MIPRIIEKITGLPTLSCKDDKELFCCQLNGEPVAIFIDVMLSIHLSGLDLIPGIRQKWPYAPIIVITALDDEAYIGKALAAGANDFVRKPLQPTEVSARLRARVAEMRHRSRDQVVTFGDLEFDRGSFGLKVGDHKVYLSPYCGRIMGSLLDGVGMVVPRDEIKLKVWGDIRVAQNTVDRRISELRSIFKKLRSRITIRSIYGGGLTLR